MKKFTSSLLPLRWFKLATLGIQHKLTLFFYLIIFSSIFIIGAYGYYHANHAYLTRAIDLARDNTARTADQLRVFLNLIRDDVGFISKFHAMQKCLYWEDIGDHDQIDYWRNIATATIRDFMYAHERYYKIRLFNQNGIEQFAVRHDPITAYVNVINRSEYQIAADPKVIKASRDLNPGEILITSIGFSTDRGSMIEYPLTLRLRLITPLRGEQDLYYGVITVSIFADALFKPIQEANLNEYGLRFYLINNAGNYLFHPNEIHSQDSFLNYKNANFYQDHTYMQENMNHAKGEIVNGGHIHAFQMIQPNSGRAGETWYLIGVINEDTALIELNKFIEFFLILFAMVSLGILLATRYMVKWLMEPLRFVTKQMQRLGRGEAIPEALNYRARDEIWEMLNSSKRVVLNLQKLATQADAIAAGNFGQHVIPLSEQDRLSAAINNMTRQLAATQLENEQRNWIKDGIAQLVRSLTGDLSAQQLTEKAISHVGRYLQAGRGVFYVRSHNVEILDLLGSYMYTQRNALGAQVLFGHSAIGQVARERKPIILDTNVIEDAPAPITTGTTNILPRYTYTWPLLREEVLYGVIEIATTHQLNENELKFLNDATETIAYFLYAVLQRERIKELLEISETATKQAQEQSRKLQEANSLMEEQQQQLQQQTEELQQINAQMEEQQQQLQQQTEELSQANVLMTKQQQRLEQQTTELTIRNQELEQSSRYKSEFLANMSHELRTPLNSILLLSKILEANERNHLDAEEIKRVQVINAAGYDLLNLINDILDLSKIEAGKMEISLQKISSTTFLADLQQQFDAIAQSKNLKFYLEDTWQNKFISDHNKLNQIIRNFLSNAFKFTQHGQISLTIKRSNEPQLPLCIAVTDTGIGIPEDKQQIIFNAFQQVDGSISRQFGGTGLGLSISLRLAQLLGGTIQVSSVLGQGSEFRLLLPARIETSHNVVAIDASSPVVNNLFHNQKQMEFTTNWLQDDRADLNGEPVILVIDDDAMFGANVTQINRKHGHKTIVAGNGKDGLLLAQTYTPVGILLDLGLPDMDGIEVLKSLKSNKELCNIPVYVISSRDPDPTLLKQGIVGYLQKPVDAQQILAAETQVLQQAATPCGILVVEDDGLSVEMIRHLLTNINAVVHAVATVDEAYQLCSTISCSLIVIGLNNENGFKLCLSFCKELHIKLPLLPIMVYTQNAITCEQEALIRRYTDSIIVQTAHADQRILENIERFVREVHDIQPAPTAAAIASILPNILTGKNILVVDDDARNLFVVTSALEQQGASVMNAIDGLKALEILSQEPVDLIFMDVMMPKMDGYKAIAAIKNNPKLKTIPIVALTAKAFQGDREQALQAGADDYLTKPVDYSVLINMAEIWCKRKL